MRESLFWRKVGVCVWADDWNTQLTLLTRGNCLFRIECGIGIRDKEKEAGNITLTLRNLHMSRNRFFSVMAAAAGFSFLCSAAGTTRAYGAPPVSVQSRTAAKSPNQPRNDASPASDFAGVVYTDIQKEEIAKIRHDFESRKEAIARDEHLNDDQKNAMTAGYARMEYAQIFQVLTPEQQKQVRQKMSARKASDAARQKTQPPRN